MARSADLLAAVRHRAPRPAFLLLSQVALADMGVEAVTDLQADNLRRVIELALEVKRLRAENVSLRAWVDRLLAELREPTR